MGARVPAALLAILVLATLDLRAQCPDGSPPPCRTGQRRGPLVNSVAILYFENLSRDTSDVYLADGLTEDITAKLGRVGRLSVTSRAAMRRFRDVASMATTELGRTLNVTYLVNGSVQRSGPRLRITVELVRAATGAQVWGDQYDRSAADLLAIQEDVARAVTTAIAGRLLPTERATLAARPTRNPQAYDHYLRGNRLLSDRRISGIQDAIAEYEAALGLDSTFTAARGRLAVAYGIALNWSFALEDLPAETLIARGVATAERAIQEDSVASDAWLGHSQVLFFRGRRDDPAAALESARRAVELNPLDDEAHHWYGAVLRRLGHFEESQSEYHRALVINPERAFSLQDLGVIAYSLHRYADAERWLDRAVALGSTASLAYVFRARVRVERNDLAGALQDATTAVRVALPYERPRAAALLAEMESRGGDHTHAGQRLQEVFAELGWPHGVPPSAISVRDACDPAQAALALGERDVALAILEHAQPRSPWLWSYLIMPGFDSLRDDPRFIKIFEESKPAGAPEVPR